MLRELLARRSAKWPVRPCQTQMASCPALSPFLFAPILLGFPLHGRCIRVLHFEPIGGAPGTVDGILALRDDAFETKLAGVGEDGRAVACGFLALLKRSADGVSAHPLRQWAVYYCRRSWACEAKYLSWL